MLTITGYDLIQIFLLLCACYGCYRLGINHGTSSLLAVLLEEGVIAPADEEE